MISNGERHLKSKPLGGARTHRTQSKVLFQPIACDPRDSSLF
nr:MAG TPA: hypothetical protein [Caudoviricetes sp.]DAN73145.1 MAG TPA: hypothetical protein [Caudoviricetes sp.]DAR83343.1 MAG TPA: hypothetical protein [Caudoviricetes sp.]